MGVCVCGGGGDSNFLRSLLCSDYKWKCWCVGVCGWEGWWLRRGVVVGVGGYGRVVVFEFLSVSVL